MQGAEFESSSNRCYSQLLRYQLAKDSSEWSFHPMGILLAMGLGQIGMCDSLMLGIQL